MSTDSIGSCCSLPPSLRIQTCGPNDRRAHASRPLRAGTVILRNAPLAHALHRDSRDGRCARCLSKRKRGSGTSAGGGGGGGGGSESLSRCSRCPRSSSAWYCSRDCQRADHHLHRFECQSTFPAVVANEASLLVRTYVQLHSRELSADCCARRGVDCVDNDGSDDDEAATTPAIRCGARHFRSLVRSSHPLDGADVLAIDAATSAVRSRPKVLPPGETPAETRLKMEDALRAFRVNNFGVSDALLNVVGGGVYPLGASLNHSCHPNCVLRYAFDPDLGPVMEVVASRDVREGEELTHSYVELAAPTAVRRQRLEAVHGFRCECRRCLGRCTVGLPRDFASRADIDDWVLERCNPSFVNPGGDVTTGEDIIDVEIDDAIAPMATAECSGVGEKTNQSLSEAISAARRKREVAKHYMAEGDLDQELKCLQEAVALLEQVVSPFSVDLYEARGDLLSTLIVSGRTADALEHCKRVVAFLCIVLSHVSNHPLLGLQLFTLGDLYEAAGELDRAKETFLWAKKVLAVSHGQQSEMVQMLNKKIG